MDAIYVAGKPVSEPSVVRSAGVVSEPVADADHEDTGPRPITHGRP